MMVEQSGRFPGLDIDEILLPQREIDSVLTASDPCLAHLPSVAARGGMFHNGNQKDRFVPDANRLAPDAWLSNNHGTLTKRR